MKTRSYLVRNGSILMAVCSSLLLSACGGDSENATSKTADSQGITSSSSSTSTSLAPKPWPANIPAAIQQRAPLPDCGEYDSTAYGAHGIGRLPASEQAKLDCFWKAYDSQSPAELRAITVVSIEGEVKSLYYRTYGGGKHEGIELASNGEYGIHACRAFGKEDSLVPTCSYN